MSESTADDATRMCLLTAPGRSALAVLAVEGPRAVEAVTQHFQSANAKPLSSQALNRVIYGHWRDEDLVVCRTADDAIEIHCHGGSRSSARILQDLAEVGCRQVSPEDWATTHAVNAIEAEAELALSSATTERTARHLLRQCQGALQTEIECIQAALHEQNIELACEKIAVLLSWKEFGLHLTQPWRIVIAGRPNVGKSSLINAIAGYQRAIVYDQPGTTRDVVSVETALDGWPVELNDTAGMHDSTDSLESEGIQRAQQEALRADLLLWVVDATSLGKSHWQDVAAVAKEQAKEAGVVLDEVAHLIVVNKIDLVEQSKSPSSEFLAISAIEERGLSELLSATTQTLIPRVPAENEAIPFTSRQVECLETLQRHCEQRETVAAIKAYSQLISNPVACVQR